MTSSEIDMSNRAYIVIDDGLLDIIGREPGGFISVHGDAFLVATDGTLDPTSGVFACPVSYSAGDFDEFIVATTDGDNRTTEIKRTSFSIAANVLKPYLNIKSFVIDHPVKPDNYLVHACLEGPEAGVYYRGKAQVSDRFAKGSPCFVEVELPDYVDALAADFTVHVTPIFDEENDNDGHYKVTEVKNGKFRIYGPPGRVNWIVYGSRGDFEVEPERSKTRVNGDGPYKWI